jgi:hypothetical protein
MSADDSSAADSDSAGLTPAQKLLFRTELAVRWRDLDAFNHVNRDVPGLP